VVVVVLVDAVVVVGDAPLRLSTAASAVISSASQVDVCAWQSPLLCALTQEAANFPSHFVSFAVPAPSRPA
jgi:hypothetical protein